MIIFLSDCSQWRKTQLTQHVYQPMSINMLINVYGSQIIFISYIHFKYKQDRQTIPHTDLRVLSVCSVHEVHVLVSQWYISSPLI